MLTRILAAALAAGSFAFATAHGQPAPTTPQTTGLPGSGSADSDKTRPSTAPTTELSDTDKIQQPIAPSSDKTRPSGGPVAESSGPSQAQQPTSSGRFDPSQYKSRIECLNAASAAYASFSLCSGLK
jgi:hypothetical protein